MRPSPSDQVPSGVTRLAVVAAVVCAGTVALLGLSGSPAAVPVGASLSGLIAVVAGVVVVRGGGWRRAAFRPVLAAGMVVYGVGQVVLGAVVARGGATFPTAGDVLSTAAVPLAVAGLAMLPRRGGEALPGIRLTVEALLIGSSAALLLWRLSFREVFLPGIEVGELAAVVILVADLSVLALVLVAAVRELDRGLLTALAGITLYVVSDLTTMRTVLAGGDWPWGALAVACVAWPLVAVGLLHVTTTPPRLAEASGPAAESRRTVVTALVACTLLLGMLGSLLADPTLDVVTIVLAGSVVVSYALGEVVRAQQARRLLSRLHELALTDTLTSLGNRRALVEALSAPSSGAPSVLTLDLDGFKQVNGMLGHTAGDVVLAAVARRLTHACRGIAATPFRLGGDEFAIVVQGTEREAELLAATLRVAVADVRHDVAVAGAVDLSACVGVAAVSSSDDRLAPLTAAAAALRVAKEAGRGTIVCYTTALAAADERRAHVEDRLRRALRADALQMHFQPIVDLLGGRVLGLEALARWDDDELGRVSPEEFVPLAEQAGLVTDLGGFVLRRSIEVHADSGAAAAGLNLGVNASAIELRSPDYVDRVAGLLHDYGVAPQRLVLEVTESLFVTDDDPALVTLHALRALGVAVAIDDFGTGYSSLAYLHRLPVNVLKVDRSLTLALDDGRIRAVLTAVVDLGSALGLDVVLEGIETPEMAASARALGLRIGQGWLYSKAVPADEVPLLVGRRFAVDHAPSA